MFRSHTVNILGQFTNAIANTSAAQQSRSFHWLPAHVCLYVCRSMAVYSIARPPYRYTRVLSSTCTKSTLPWSCPSTDRPALIPEQHGLATNYRYCNNNSIATYSSTVHVCVHVYCNTLASRYGSGSRQCTSPWESIPVPVLQYQYTVYRYAWWESHESRESRESREHKSRHKWRHVGVVLSSSHYYVLFSICNKLKMP